MEMELAMAEEDLLLAISAVEGDTGIDLSNEDDVIPLDADVSEDLLLWM